MSAVQAQALLEKAANDVVFRQSLENAQTKDEKQAILVAAGFDDVTNEEIMQAAAASRSELSDAELEAVAGGATASWVGVAIAIIALLI